MSGDDLPPQGDLQGDYANFPQEPGIPQLRWLIENVAEDKLPVEELIRSFRSLHESIERSGRPKYKSKDEARLIWDVLWMLEFYSPNPALEENPAEWHTAADVLAEVQRVAKHLKQL
jgi:hypothetical protein